MSQTRDDFLFYFGNSGGRMKILVDALLEEFDFIHEREAWSRENADLPAEERVDAYVAKFGSIGSTLSPRDWNNRATAADNMLYKAIGAVRGAEEGASW